MDGSYLSVIMRDYENPESYFGYVVEKAKVGTDPDWDGTSWTWEMDDRMCLTHHLESRHYVRVDWQYYKCCDFEEGVRPGLTEKTKRKYLREVIKSRCFPGIIIPSTRTPLAAASDRREMAARETLRRVVGEDAWRRFLKNGFIQVRAKSGRYYQIFPGHKMTKVWENGRHIETLCVVLPSSFPVTDSIIMRYLLVLNNEEDFWARSIKHGAFKKAQPDSLPNPTSQDIPLTELAKLYGIKVA